MQGTIREFIKVTSYLVSLLLGQRLQFAFKRWKSARHAFSAMGDSITRAVLQASVWVKDAHLLVSVGVPAYGILAWASALAK